MMPNFSGFFLNLNDLKKSDDLNHLGGSRSLTVRMICRHLKGICERFMSYVRDHSKRSNDLLLGISDSVW